MENASKALLIAAGVLIGLIIASIFVYEMVVMSENGRVYHEEIERVQVQEFNARFQKYSGKILDAQDVVTIMGFIDEWNSQNADQITAEASAGLSTELYKFVNRIGEYAGDATKRDAEFLQTDLPDEDGFGGKYTCELSYGTNNGGRITKVTFKYKI